MAQLQPGDPWHVGPYEVVARLTTDAGIASIGRLYLAHYPGAGRVAMRVIGPRLAADAGLRAGISDGVEPARAVDSPLACRLRAAAILTERAPWIAWEYAPGPSLAAVLAEHPRLPEAAITGLAAGLADALRAIHDAGAVHGDLRPATVFQADGRPLVTGFGVAAAVQAVARALPATFPAPGTGQATADAGLEPDPRLFIAPELASGGVIGPAGDMFSLGAVVAYAAGGKGPFGIGGPAGSPYHAPYGTPDLGSVPAALCPLITRCLDSDPGWRPTAGEFRSLVASLFPDAPERAEWPEVEISDPVPQAPVPATVTPAPAPAPLPAPPPPAPARRVSPARQSYRPVPAMAAGRGAVASRQKKAAIIACLLVLLLVLVIGMAGITSGSGAPAAPVPGAQQLYYPDYQTGDCLYGHFPNTGGGTWPDAAWQVACDQPHTDEVVYANASFYPVNGSYPGDDAIREQGKSQCDNQFMAYEGTTSSDSIYSFIYVAPDAQTWPDGDRELACIAFYPTTAKPDGDVLRASIKGTHL